MPKSKAQADEPAITRKNGRPTKFEARFIQQARKMALLGLTDAEIADVLEVTHRTFKTWKNTHAKLAEALREGKTIADANVAAALYERAIGYRHKETVLHQHGGKIIRTEVVRHYPPDTQAATKWLHNRDRKRWQANPELAEGDDVPTPVQVTFQIVDARKRPPDAGAQPTAG